MGLLKSPVSMVQGVVEGTVHVWIGSSPAQITPVYSGKQATERHWSSVYIKEKTESKSIKSPERRVAEKQ